jgi:hypothetical protein
MKRKTALPGIVVLLLVVLAGVWWLSRSNPDPPGGTTAEGAASPVSNSPRPRPDVDDSTHVTFPGLEPVRFTERHSGPFGEIARSFEPLEKRFPWVSDGRWKDIRENSLEILTTDDGGIVRISRNRGLFPSVSEKRKVLAAFQKSAIEVLRMGNEFANIRNAFFMVGLFQTLIEYGSLQHAEADENGVYSLVPVGELEIIPITYIDRGGHHEGSPPNTEHPGLLWMTKYAHTLPEDIAAMWHYDIPIEDARWVKWIIIPIDINQKEGGYWQMSNRETWIDTPDFTFERKIRSLGDPPDRPITAPYSGPTPAGYPARFNEEWYKKEAERIRRQTEGQ